MKRVAALLAGAALLATTSSAMATTVNLNSGEDSLQTILNGVTVGGTSSVNVATDFIKDPNDSLWKTGAVGISSATMIIELAGRAGSNNFGIYDSSNILNTALLFGGVAATGSKVSLTFGDYSQYGFSDKNLLIRDLTNPLSTGVLYHFDTTTFGFYFNSDGKTFYSDTTKNADGYDHMVAYGSPGNDSLLLKGNLAPGVWAANEYVLAFEDTYGGGDHDYNDMVLMVESVAPVPEPGTMLLLGAGFLGLAIYGKRRKNA